MKIDYDEIWSTENILVKNIHPAALRSWGSNGIAITKNNNNNNNNNRNNNNNNNNNNDNNNKKDNGENTQQFWEAVAGEEWRLKVQLAEISRWLLVVWN